jgi:hypothetical protein
VATVNESSEGKEDHMIAPKARASTLVAPLPLHRTLQVGVLDNPAGRVEFRDFRCGDDSMRFWVGKGCKLRPKQQPVIEVHGIVKRLYLGRADPQVVIALEESGQLIGLCGVRRHLYQGTYPIAAEYYINVIGRNQGYTGFHPEADMTAGYVLLRAALEQIEIWSVGAMPFVWALVWLDNEPSNTIFAAHGFETFFPEDPGGQSIRLRPALEIPRGSLMLQNPRQHPSALS